MLDTMWTVRINNPQVLERHNNIQYKSAVLLTRGLDECKCVVFSILHIVL